MQISTKPSMLIWVSIIFGLAGIFTRGTKIQYQVIVQNDASTTASPLILNQEGYVTVIGDKYGRDAFSCEGPILESLPNSKLVNRLSVWRFIGGWLSLLTLCLVLVYVVRHVSLPLRFYALVGIIVTGAVMLFWLINTKTVPSCNPEVVYRVVSFTPNWVTILVLVAATLFGYLANRRQLNANAF